MTETLLPSREHHISTDVLASGDELRSLYSQRFEEMELPTTYQMSQDLRYGERVFSTGAPDSPLDPEELRREFVHQSTREAYDDSWWTSLRRSLEMYAADPAQAVNIHLAAKHTLDVTYNKKPTNQQYEVFEIGDTEPDVGASAVVFDTLKLIDQFSGGALAADSRRPKVVLGNGIHLVNNPHGEGEGLGFNTGDVIFINTSRLREIAAETGADFHELLAVTTVHEFLGHGLERSLMRGTGRYFPQHFHYSSERSRGSMFDTIHSVIKPKDDLHAGSHPVREYGEVNAEEDLATSVDSVVAIAMGWTKSTDKYPRMSSRADAYRRDLVMQLMHDAADIASKYDANPGLVGSEIRYVTDEIGKVVAVEPARDLEITTVSGQEAVQQEIEKQVQKRRPDGTFVIYDDDIM